MAFVDSMRFELLDLFGQHVGWLGEDGQPRANADSWEIEVNIYRSVWLTGSIMLDGPLPDAKRLMIRAWRDRLDTWTGETTSYPRGVGVITGQERTLATRWTSDGDLIVPDVPTKLTIMGREVQLQREPVADNQRNYPSGAILTDMIGGVLDNLVGAGKVGYSVTPSPAKAAAPWHFEPDDSKLDLVSGVCDALGYQLTVGMDGTVSAAPYVPPYRRTPTLDFSPDPDADWFKEGIPEASDAWDIPNVLIGTANRSGDGPDGKPLPPLVYRAENRTVGPYSYEALGYWQKSKTEPVLNLECPDLASLKIATDRSLQLRAWAPRSWDLTIDWRPLAGAETATLDYAGSQGLATVHSFKEDARGTQQVTLREVWPG